MQQYQRAQVETASPTRLIVLLYDGAIRFCSLAQDAMVRRDLETQNTNIQKAQRIIGELMSSLNRADGGEVASNLFRIYSHVMEELVKANLEDDGEALRHVTAVLKDLRETWAEIDRVTSAEQGSPDEGIRGTGAPGASATHELPSANRPGNIPRSLAPSPGAPVGTRSRLGDRGA